MHILLQQIEYSCTAFKEHFVYFIKLSTEKFIKITKLLFLRF